MQKETIVNFTVQEEVMQILEKLPTWLAVPVVVDPHSIPEMMV